ncbi:tetratricopeptide repeat protein [filamentous cyanobacterium LEGE 11480]|uniref:Tetratricopeptide repeat protein n=1 Tax=Romeriopsis navalis LEGE 11480 TaxID=2777977 RepID=A0A928VL71_9CYAN|nr:tetratricopeptide repeat protein [Romeriopsis navalis]MBE9028661.1 tetratricopeptide repeat protein [Romeriopsis navalis LEGE 11480]
MTVITIAQNGKVDNDFTAKLTVGGSEFLIQISDPFRSEPKREAELEWYFERWITFPFTDTTIAARAAASAKDYGTALFDQVFGDRKAYAAYQQVAGNLSDLEIVIVGDPAFQGLHWESLWDGDMPRPLSIDCVMVRQRRMQGGGLNVQRQDSTTLNLLVMTARPDEAKDVGYRTISRPLVEGIDKAQVPVNVELVRPGSYKAFVQQLEARGEGYYHLVHFDMHGGLMNYEQFQAGCEAGSDYSFQRGYGLEAMPQYEGVQAFLFFEGDAAGQSVPVSAQEMTERLGKYGISACILNACQSGKQVSGPLAPNSGGTEPGEQSVDVRETSLGARLMDAGMQTVIAMAYSVTVDAARLMVENLYGNLFAQVPVDKALQQARRELHAKKLRQVSYGQKVDLEDWLLPVVYRNQAVDLKLRRMYPEEAEAYWTQKGSRFQFGNQFRTEYGFVGRDLEILQIEKGLIRRGNVLMLHGMGGTGKTTLLRYLQDWWVQTGFVDGVSYFGYDTKGWKLAQILDGVARAVLNEVEMREFQPLPQVAQMARLVQALKAKRWLIVLDNLESVTGQALAIQNTLNPDEQRAIRDFLVQLNGGATRVLLGSRRRENWLGDAYGANVYELRGLDPQARTVLAEKVLARHVADAPKRLAMLADKRDFGRLMKLLAGYPLAIEVVLANLGRQTVAEVLQGLDAADVRLDQAGSQDKTSSILQCVEYSHGNLSAAAQKNLLCLAPFSGFIHRGLLPNYVQQLQASGTDFAHLTPDLLDDAVQEAINWGLLSPINAEHPSLLTIQPVFPYFLKTKLAAQDEAFQSALQSGFKNHYEGLAGSYQQLMTSKEPQEKQTGIIFCQLEYENLYHALQIALTRQESINIFVTLDKYLELKQDIQAELQLAEEVNQVLATYPTEWKTGDGAREYVIALNLLGYCYLMTKQYEKAKSTYSQELTAKNSAGDRLSQARTYHQLGRVAQELREWEQARAHYNQALQIKIEFNDRYEQAGTYHQLGIVAQALREFEQARTHYNQALQIKIEFNDRYEQARTYHQLGIVAQALREFEQARTHYNQALQIQIEFNDRYSQAGTYHQLGIVAQELREFEQARTHYNQALQIQIEFNDRYSQARTYHQLGIVAQELREFEQARTHYNQALQIQIEFNDRYEQAGTYHQLGRVAEELREFEQAAEEYLKALETYIEFSAHHNLGIVLRSCNRLLKSHPSPQLLSAISQRLGSSEAEVTQLFEQMSAASV